VGEKQQGTITTQSAITELKKWGDEKTKIQTNSNNEFWSAKKIWVGRIIKSI
jgi:hypothetical protein